MPHPSRGSVGFTEEPWSPTPGAPGKPGQETLALPGFGFGEAKSTSGCFEMFAKAEKQGLRGRPAPCC